MCVLSKWDVLEWEIWFWVREMYLFSRREKKAISSNDASRSFIDALYLFKNIFFKNSCMTTQYTQIDMKDNKRETSIFNVPLVTISALDIFSLSSKLCLRTRSRNHTLPISKLYTILISPLALHTLCVREWKINMDFKTVSQKSKILYTIGSSISIDTFKRNESHV